MPKVVAMFLLAIMVAIYPFIVLILWRNLKLSEPWKSIFSLSVFPVFLTGMVVNIWLTYTYVPWLLDMLYRVGKYSFKGAVLGFAIAAPALAVSFLWYLLIRAADRWTR